MSDLLNLTRLMYASSNKEAVASAENLLKRLWKEENVWRDHDGSVAAAGLLALDNLSEDFVKEIFSHPDAPMDSLCDTLFPEEFLPNDYRQRELRWPHALAILRPSLVKEYVAAGGLLKAEDKDQVGPLPYLQKSSLQEWFALAQKQNADLAGGSDTVSWISVFSHYHPLGSQELSQYQKDIAALKKQFPIVLSEEEKSKQARRDFIYMLRTLPGKNVMLSNLRMLGLEKEMSSDPVFFKNCTDVFCQAIIGGLGFRNYSTLIEKSKHSKIVSMVNWLSNQNQKNFPSVQTSVKDAMALLGFVNEWSLSAELRQETKTARKAWCSRPVEEKLSSVCVLAPIFPSPEAPSAAFAEIMSSSVPPTWKDIKPVLEKTNLSAEKMFLDKVVKALPSHLEDEDKKVLGKCLLDKFNRGVVEYDFPKTASGVALTEGVQGKSSQLFMLFSEACEVFLRNESEPYEFSPLIGGIGQDIKTWLSHLVGRENLHKAIAPQNVPKSAGRKM